MTDQEVLSAVSTIEALAAQLREHLSGKPCEHRERKDLVFGGKVWKCLDCGHAFEGDKDLGVIADQE